MKPIQLTQAELEQALRLFVPCLDYDLHKNLECDEETSKDHYPEVTEDFIRIVERIQKG